MASNKRLVVLDEITTDFIHRAGPEILEVTHGELDWVAATEEVNLPPTVGLAAAVLMRSCSFPCCFS